MKPVPPVFVLVTLGALMPFALAQENYSTASTHEIHVAEASASGGGQTPIGPGYKPASAVTYTSSEGSTYVPMDSWIYPALDRLHALGYLDSAFLGLRPWTRLSIAHMLQQTADRVEGDSNNDEAREIFLSVQKEVQPDIESFYGTKHGHAELESIYTQFRGISGTPLRDSFHLGQTIVNDYGRPYQEGFNNYTGASARAQSGRFSLYVRGEFQHAPSAAGYSPALAAYLSNTIDAIPYLTNPSQATIPAGPISSVSEGRILEANISYHLLGHEISFGKNDHWLGPAQGASMAWGNNAENIYAFEINRVEPLRIPLVSRLTGPFRYDFYVGTLKGHTAPNAPWVHAEKISFKPTPNLEFGFERTVIWGGEGHVPITIHSFLKSFFSFQNVSAAEKASRNDPGARFGAFDFNYRLPYMRNWLTLYSDSFAHDDVSPISAPRRAAFRPGLYLSHFPVVEHLDLRVEGASTDPDTSRSDKGSFFYYEGVQKQGPTNKGFIVGDWIGRQSKGGQAWITYHLSPQENIQFMYRRAKASPLNQAGTLGFLPGGTTQNDFQIAATKRFLKDIEVKGYVQYEQWKAPIYKTGSQSDTSIAAQITWYPHEQKQF